MSLLMLLTVRPSVSLHLLVHLVWLVEFALSWSIILLVVLRLMVLNDCAGDLLISLIAVFLMIQGIPFTMWLVSPRVIVLLPLMVFFELVKRSEPLIEVRDIATELIIHFILL